jgi:hypothetical protein
MNHPEMRSTVFGEVLASLLEARDIPATPFKVGMLAKRAGLDGSKVLKRMADVGAENPGYLYGLADELDLSEPEKMRLAFAYTFERHIYEVAVEALSEVNGCLSHAIDVLESVPPAAFADPEERFRLQRLIAQAGGIVATEEAARA